MTANQTQFAAGYQAALADVGQARHTGGDAAVAEWLRNNVDITIRPGSRIYRWWDAGAGKTAGMQQQPLTVVRANRQTLTVDTDQGSRFRLPLADVAGRYAEDSPAGDWVAALMADTPPVPRNPHYRCSMADDTPCPTGEHVNPATPPAS